MKNNFKPYLALEASAGSGKTYALSVRYISLLFLGANPSKILTLTFTNKAAAEMKSRIYEVLRDLKNRGELEQISFQVGESPEEILARKDEVLEKFLKEDLLISTIDSFFAKILRKFALNAGFMPDFKIETNTLEKEVLKRFLSLCVQEKKYDTLLKFSINENRKLSDIFTLLNEFYDKESEFDPKAVEQALHVSPKNALEITKQLKEVVVNSGASKSAVNIFDEDEIGGLIGKTVFEKEDLRDHRFFKKYYTDEMGTLFGELKMVLAKYLNERESYLLGELSELFYIYKHSIRLSNKDLSTLSFSDVTNALYTLINDVIKKDFLYFRLDGKIDHILIDEFQDTNIMQYKILAPLMEEVSAGVGASEFKSLFFVGDIKQSIYRFRGGAKELFAYAREQFGVTREVLDTNYRSSQNVVKYVNNTFVNLIKGYEPQLVNSKLEGFVDVDFSDDIAHMVLHRTQYLLEEGVEAKDIAILTHKNKDARELKDLLLENIEGINVQTEATIKLIHVPIVGAVIDLLKYAYFGYKLYKENFLVVIGFSWEEELDISWLNLNHTPMQMIINIVKRYEIFADDMDILKLVELSSRYVDIESFLFESENFSEDAKSEDNDGIKILTIHKSKGLEFEHIIIADRLGMNRGGGGTLLYEYDDVNLSGIFQRVKGREFLDKRYEVAKNKEKELEKEDILNMHYVAFTRAEKSLLICAKNKSSAFEHLHLEKTNLGSLHVEKKATCKQKELHVMSQTLKSYGVQESTKTEKSSDYDHFAITYGLALHYCLEMMSEFTIASLNRSFEATKNRYTSLLSDESLDSLHKRVSMLIENQEFLSLIEGGVLSKEQPLVYNEERKQIDLLVQKDDEVVVIDYKSSLHVSQSHLKQVGYYKKALAKISGKRVIAKLIYLRESEIVLVDV